MNKTIPFVAMTLLSVTMLGMTAFAATSKTTISSVRLNVTSNIKYGDPKSESNDNVSASTNTNGVDVNQVEVTNKSSYGEWGSTDKPKIKVSLKTESSKFQFDNDISKDDITVDGMDVDSYTVKKSGNSRLYVTITGVQLSDIEGADTSSDYKLEVSSVYLDSSTGEASWDEADDANKYEVRLYRKSSGSKDNLLKSVNVNGNKDTYDFSSYITSTGTYFVRVRAVRDNSHKGAYVNSEVVTVDSDELEYIKEYRDRKESESKDSTNKTSNGSADNTPDTPGKHLDDVYYSKGVEPIVGNWSSYKDENGNTNWTLTTNNHVYQNEWAYVKNPFAKPELGQESADWFRFNGAGVMVTGWFMDENGDYYYLSNISDGTRGKMVTGWQEINGYLYYFEPTSNGKRGCMYKNTTVDGRAIGVDGRVYR